MTHITPNTGIVQNNVICGFTIIVVVLQSCAVGRADSILIFKPSCDSIGLATRVTEPWKWPLKQACQRFVGWAECLR